MSFSGMLRRVALVRAKVSEERSASIISVTRVGELGITLAVTSNRRALQRNSMRQSNLTWISFHLNVSTGRQLFCQVL
jgi:hypothetical protein